MRFCSNIKFGILFVVCQKLVHYICMLYTGSFIFNGIVWAHCIFILRIKTTCYHSILFKHVVNFLSNPQTALLEIYLLKLPV